MGLNDSFSIRKCARCGAAFVDPLPTIEQIRGVYEDVFTYQSEFNPAEEKGYRRYVTLAGKASGGKPGKLLDVGCASGAVLKEAVGCGWESWGVDLSEKLLKKAAERVPEAKLLNCELKDAGFAPGEFDVVTALNLLEHVLDPRDLLQEVHRILRPGGAFLFKTVRIDSMAARKRGFNWDHLKWPGHFVWFTRKSLLSMLKESGYTVKKFTVTGIPYLPGVKRYMDHHRNSGTDKGTAGSPGGSKGNTTPLVKRAIKGIMRSWALKRVFAWFIAAFHLGDTVTILAVKKTGSS